MLLMHTQAAVKGYGWHLATVVGDRPRALIDAFPATFGVRWQRQKRDDLTRSRLGVWCDMRKGS